MTAAVPAPEVRGSRKRVRRAWAAVSLPLISIILALFVGAIVIIASELLVGTGSLDLGLPLKAYGALFNGAFGGPDALVQTAVSSAPLLLAALGVGFGFKA